MPLGENQEQEDELALRHDASLDHANVGVGDVEQGYVAERTVNTANISGMRIRLHRHCQCEMSRRE